MEQKEDTYISDLHLVTTFLNVIVYYYFPFLSLTHCILHFAVPFDVQDFSTFSFLDSQDKTVVISDSMKYLTKKGTLILFEYMHCMYMLCIWVLETDEICQ